MRKIAVMNQKGGVGKTTTAAHLAHALALSGERVLMIDLDPQSHLAPFFGLYDQQSGLDRVIMFSESLQEHIKEVRPGLFLLAAGSALHDVELEDRSKKRGGLLRQLLSNCEDWDYVVMDCPPSSGLMVIMAMYAADEVLIPVTADYLGLQGLSSLLATLKNFETRLKHKPKRWLALTRFHTRRKISNQGREKLLKYFPKSLLATAVRESAALAACPSFGKTAFEFQSSGHGAQDYRDLAGDIMARRILHEQ
ncbi:MAG: ParA family protein [Mariprofundaceae bacterium]